jgi:hypothetical protein
MGLNRSLQMDSFESKIFWALRNWSSVQGFYEWELVEGAKTIAEALRAEEQEDRTPGAKAEKATPRGQGPKKGK